MIHRLEVSRFSLAGPLAVVAITTALALTLAPGAASAEVIRVTPSDGFAEIERARAGDEVVVSAGTYDFRVFLSQSGTAAMPIVIRAEDPATPPVWDMSGRDVEDAPGSSTRGDRGRGCWQVTGSYYEISGLVIRGCSTGSGNSAGLRAVGSDHLTVRNVVFEDNQVGMSGNGEDTLAEFCEFRGNGVHSSPPQHSTYIFGGSFTLRYSYVHDSVGGQNLHIRARRSVIEYNWIARAFNYEADMMPGPGDDHEMIFRGNVLISHRSPENSSKIFTLFNDTGRSGVNMNLRIIWNTIIVQGSGNPALVAIRNDTLGSASVEIANNVIVGTNNLARIGDSGASNWTLSGGNNHLVPGTNEMGLSGNVFGDDPGFMDAASLDYRPQPGSPLVGAADTGVAGAPAGEYAENEIITRGARPRATAADIGAFGVDRVDRDAGTMTGDGGTTPGDGGMTTGDGGTMSGPDSGSLPSDGGGGDDEPVAGGCGCRVGAQSGPGRAGGPLALLLLALVGVLRTRSRRG